MTPRAAVPPIPAPFSSYEPDPCPECSSPAILRNGDARKCNACGAHYEAEAWAEYEATIGRALLALYAAKVGRGVDFYVSSSWCSDFPVVVTVVRRSGVGVPMGRPAVGGIREAMERAVRESVPP